MTDEVTDPAPPADPALPDGAASPAPWSYRGGSWFGVFGSATALLLPASEKTRVGALWALIDDGAGFDSVLDALLQSGLGALPGFVLVAEADGVTRLLVRGAGVSATVSVGGEAIEVTAPLTATWAERTLSGVAALTVSLDAPQDAALGAPVAPDAPDVPDRAIDAGLVRVGRVDRPARTAPVAAPVVQAPPSPAPVSDPEPVLLEPVLPEPVSEPVSEEVSARVSDPVDDLVDPGSGDGFDDVPTELIDLDGAPDPLDPGEPADAVDALDTLDDAPIDAPPAPGDALLGLPPPPLGPPPGPPSFAPPAPPADPPADPPIIDVLDPPTEAPSPLEPSPLDVDSDTSDVGVLGEAATDGAPSPEEEPVPSGASALGYPPPPPPTWAPPSTDLPPPPVWGGGPVGVDDHDGLTQAGVDSREFAREQPGIPGQPMAPSVTKPVARLVVSSGESVEVDRVILVGRAPEARRFTTTEQPLLITVPSPLHEISSTHLEVRPGSGADHGSAVVTDMGSTNGTVLEQPGLGPEDLKPGIAVQLIPGAVINLGDGVTISVTNP